MKEDGAILSHNQDVISNGIVKSTARKIIQTQY